MDASAPSRPRPTGSLVPGSARGRHRARDAPRSRLCAQWPPLPPAGKPTVADDRPAAGQRPVPLRVERPGRGCHVCGAAPRGHRRVGAVPGRCSAGTPLPRDFPDRDLGIRPPRRAHGRSPNARPLRVTPPLWSYRLAACGPELVWVQQVALLRFLGCTAGRAGGGGQARCRDVVVDLANRVHESHLYAFDMNTPSRVSIKHIPAAKRIGSAMVAARGKPPAIASNQRLRSGRPPRVAVLNPSPTRCMWADLVMNVSYRPLRIPLLRPRWASRRPRSTAR